MDDIVPSALLRLREADIVSLAGLTSASLGQEYSRSGFVSAMKRQGACLSGVLEIPETSLDSFIKRLHVEQTENGEEPPDALPAPTSRFKVEIEMGSRSSCQTVCICGNQTGLICAHAAALLYQWIQRPSLFTSALPTVRAPATPSKRRTTMALNKTHTSVDVSGSLSTGFPSSKLASVRHALVHTIGETLTQFSLSDIRGIAREYGVTVTNLGRQQLMETLIETLSQPETIRRVVGTLEKPQRQLLAALALAGGSLKDEELRGLFKRFGLDHAGSLQDMLTTLQAKLLLVRTSFNYSLQQPSNLHTPPLDISWYIPVEVREALHVTLPVTRFDITVPYKKSSHSALPIVQLAEPSKLLADMLLIARALDGTTANELYDKRSLRHTATSATNRLSTDGSLALPPPEDQPSPAMIESLQASLRRSPSFLHLAIRLLHLGEILQKEDDWPTHLRVLPHAAQLLLSPARYDVLYDLFVQWANQSTYTELFELAESGVRVRCRGTPINQPALRHGELEQENSEARQELLALLTQVPKGEWVNFSAFARFIYRLHPTFLQRRQHLFPAPHWWIEQEEGRLLHPTEIADWLLAEGRYLASLIQGPLHWWGICDLALSADNQLLAFRLTPLVDLLFHGLPAVPQQGNTPEGSKLVVTVDELVLIPSSSANWPLIACIEDFAESMGVQNGQLSYRLSAHSLNEAICRGRDPRSLLTLLTQAACLGENHELCQLLKRLESRITNYGRTRLYTDVSLVQTADPAVMQQLEAIISLDEQTIRPVHPSLLILKKEGIERLLEELKRRGQVPLLHEEG
jgi:hypothetical protein